MYLHVFMYLRIHSPPSRVGRTTAPKDLAGLGRVLGRLGRVPSVDKQRPVEVEATSY